MDRVIGNLDLKPTLVVVLSKSGGTKETRNAMLEVQHAYQLAGVDFASETSAVTVKGSVFLIWLPKNLGLAHCLSGTGWAEEPLLQEW